MTALWYAIVTAMLTTWAVLDGFDFGAGIVQRLVAKTEEERATVIAAIGPVWDGNEVWLVAAGGVFVFAFPVAYATALSGMYLAIVLVLWLLILRGVGIEFRAQLDHPLWRAAWDAVFAFASAALALVSGVALGNIIRGVPLDASGRFHLDLFALSGDRVGAIDFYTAAVGVFAIVVLATHGALYLAWKTEGPLSERCLRLARRAWIAQVVLLVIVTAATVFVRPDMFRAFGTRPWAWPLPLGAIAGLIVSWRASGTERRAFLGSSLFVACLILSTAATLYPAMLPSILGRQFDLNADAAASGHLGLTEGLLWWMPAIALAALYFVNVFRSMRGKVRPSTYGH